MLLPVCLIPSRNNSLPGFSWLSKVSKELTSLLSPAGPTYPLPSNSCVPLRIIFPKNYTLPPTLCFGLYAAWNFLDSLEFTVPCYSTNDPGTHLSLTDISLDNRDNPRLIAASIMQSKTDSFQKRVTLYLGVTNHPFCPVAGILPYLALRGSQPGPLFLTKGQGLTRQALSTSLDTVVTKLHLQSSGYNTHSFSISATTSAAQANIPDWCIKILGPWKSDAYQQYIWMQSHELARFSGHTIT